MKHHTRTTYLTGGILAALLILGGCNGGDGPAEQAGEEIDEAVESAEDTAEDAAESAGDAMEEAGDEVEEATD